MVGDVVDVQQGNAVPCDGLVIRCIGDVKITEASLTGETLPLEKSQFSEPYLLRGSECVGGEVVMLATAVGDSTANGKLMAGLKGDRAKQRKEERKAEQADLGRHESDEEDEEPCCYVIPCPLFGCEDPNEEDESRTPLQVKLDVLANQIGYCGTGAAFALFQILLLKQYAN
eukprot:UN26736